MDIVSSLGFGGSVVAGVFTVLNSIVPEPYMDEIFHVPQAKLYCQHFPKFWEAPWDNMITTLPGTYIYSSILHQVWSYAKIEEISNDECSTTFLRASVALFSVLNIYAIQSCIQALYPTNKESPSPWLQGLVLSWFPLLFFFNFFYYTDCGSTFFVLMCYSTALQKRYLLSGIFGTISIIFRQTNVVWVLFSVGAVFLRTCNSILKSDKRTSTTRFPLLSRTVDCLSCLYQHPLVVLRDIWIYVFVTVGFLIFVYLNEGIVVGDRSSHRPVLHVAQLLYFSFFCALFGGPCLWLPTRLKELIVFLGRDGMVLGLLKVTTMILLFSFIIAKFTFAHKYLLADNRHYTFYIWRKIIDRNIWSKYAMLCVYVPSWLQMSCQFCKKQDALLFLGFVLTCGAALIPAELLEFRYFILPYIMFRVHLPPQTGLALAWEAVIYIAINATTIFAFIKWPFQWPNAPDTQHFMW
eukprot:m.61882 g.61882  ORF g.61882 m.61882 type:complete len:465 (+) comp11459_c0_seq2:146-1540(+)